LSGLLTAPAFAQTPEEDLLRSQQTWQFNCIEKGCLASVDILRGESGDPPDPNDPTQYVSVSIGVNYSDHKPSIVMFEVDPKADKDRGLNLVFAHSVSDGKGWKLLVDPAPIHLTFRVCNETDCRAVVGSAKPDEAAIKSCADMIAKMRSGDHLFLTYRKNGHAYRTAVSLTLFKEAYGKLLTKVGAGPSKVEPKIVVP